MTSTNTTSPVPAPAGATAADWDTLDGQRFRIIRGPQHRIPGRDDVAVTASAVQLPDGTIDNGTAIEGPLVFVDASSYGISVADAAALAVALIEAVRDVDGWRSPNTGRQLTLL